MIPSMALDGVVQEIRFPLAYYCDPGSRHWSESRDARGGTRSNLAFLGTSVVPVIVLE
jgi:hypothetical protein